MGLPLSHFRVGIPWEWEWTRCTYFEIGNGNCDNRRGGNENLKTHCRAHLSVRFAVSLSCGRLKPLTRAVAADAEFFLG